MEILKDFANFIIDRKKYWLLPTIIVLLLVGLLIIAGGSGAGAFIYTLF